MTDAPGDRQRDWEDRAIQDLLASPQNLADLMRLISATLAEQLDFSRMIPVRHRYVLPDLHKLESDLVFEIPFREGEHAVWIYILLEHQSEPDRKMPLRLLGYMVELWLAQARRLEENKAPNWQLYPILPILFYTGSRRWSTPLQLDSLMDLPAGLAQYVPRFETLILSLRDMPDEVLLTSALGSGMIALREADESSTMFEQALRRALAGIEEHSEANRIALEAVLLFVYRLVIHHRDRRELDVLARLAQEELTSGRREQIEEALMTGAEALRQQGFERGIERGIEQGMQQGEARILLSLATQKFGSLPEIIRSRVARLPHAQLEALTGTILHLPDPAALEIWLNQQEASGE